MALKIEAHSGVGILIEGQAGGGVLNENVRQPNLNFGQIGAVLLNEMGYQMEAASEGGQAKGRLIPGQKVTPNVATKLVVQLQ